MKRIIAFVLVLILLCAPVLAHSGGTDSDGGHYDSATGEYHYHHGHPAHQHPNGICPYDFKDNAIHNESSVNTRAMVEPSGLSVQKRGFSYVFDKIARWTAAVILGIFMLSPVIFPIIASILKRNRQKESQQKPTNRNK